ncbi:regulatory protein RecX [Alteromonas sp. a30]|uniref:regulatory protein RecX n=1 Tax=Alteromonas sp. a30 TaxID=2730917 RepID=UPI00227EE591|nr:regulatory protein RecX [Alteromonas sp. a30]MCY7297309.1 regulatory protein RecX [Alteromonas sp. a30]
MDYFDEFEQGMPQDIENTKRLIRQAITRYLAQREHGFNEILYKLTQKGFPQALSRIELEAMQERGWQSDERYTKQLVQRRINKGYGLQFIQGEARSKGIEGAVLQSVMDELQPDWCEVAKNAAIRKFGDTPIKDNKDYIKRCNFLRNRGFGLTEISAVYERFY